MVEEALGTPSFGAGEMEGSLPPLAGGEKRKMKVERGLRWKRGHLEPSAAV